MFVAHLKKEMDMNEQLGTTKGHVYPAIAIVIAIAISLIFPRVFGDIGKFIAAGIIILILSGVWLWLYIFVRRPPEKPS